MKQLRVIPLFLLCLLLAGCVRDTAQPPVQAPDTPTTVITGTLPPDASQATDAPTQPSEESSAAPSIPAQNVLQPGNPKTLSEWVFTNYDETFSWRDGVGNICSMRVTLPALAPVSDFAIAFNEEIRKLGGYALDEAVFCRETASSNTLLGVSYEAYLNGEILSILLIQQYDADYTVYNAFSFDIEDRESLRTADLCEELLDMNYPSFILATNAITEYHFRDSFGEYIESMENQYVSTDSYFETESREEIDLYHEILDFIPYDTVSIRSRQLFVGRNGQIMLVYDAPSIAGASHYPTVIPFDAGVTGWKPVSEETAYGELLRLTDYVDGAYADSYSGMLLEAFLGDSEDFAEHAARSTATRQDAILSLLDYALYRPDDITCCRQECRELLSEEHLSPAEQAFISRLLELAQQKG